MARVRGVPVVMQMEATECGAASLNMILAYYGLWVPLEEVRERCGVSRDGSKASNVLRAARSYGMEADGYVYGIKALRQFGSLPCILFWNMSHFVVLTGFSRNGNWAYLNDPARGEVRVGMDEFSRSFTGVTLVLSPTDAFKPSGHPASTVAFVRSRLAGMGGAILFVAASTAIVAVLELLESSFARIFADKVLEQGSNWWLSAVVVSLALFAALQLVVSFAGAIYLVRIQGKFAVTSSARFMWHLLHLPVSFYSQRYIGDLQRRQASNANIAMTVVQQLAPVFVNAAMLVLYLVVMLTYSVPLALVGVTAVALNALMASYISRRRVNVMRQQVRDMGRLQSATMSGIQMIDTIKSSGSEEGFFERWSGIQALVNNGRVGAARIDGYLGSVPLLITSLANVAVLGLGALLVLDGHFTVGMLLAFQGFFSAFMTPVSDIVELGQSLQEARTEMERVQDVMGYEPDVPEQEAPVTGGEDDGFSKLGGAIDVEGLTFGYSRLEKPIIEGIDLHVKPGQWVALVGGSGSGKSTIAKLVSGLYQPWAGSISMDGTPLSEVPRHILRSSLAVVDQDIVAFSGSVADNVRLWDASIADYDVILACNDASIHRDIVRREGGYQGRLGPGGRNFSGGQLQRIEIARALAIDPTILVLDEATSALDAKTEADVIDAVRKRGITCIVVAHRLSTIRECDEIIVLEQGRVVERGTHDELMTLDGAYAALVRSD